ncbi:hypothetical protein [Alkalimonas amylolytica]|uniref:glutathione synthase n=1 Tax=Alkalimonas amylolytica TaxID=152573 RepID=A0A1H4BJ74_ALKAM|nr:hypothetical protein [Alkalimonas amylolytica]SEA47852.1 glutathione synthase [Alkalimonas amylolytica]
MLHTTKHYGIPAAIGAAEFANRQLGLEQKSVGFVPAPVSHTPWQLEAKLWQQAQHKAQLLGQLLVHLSQQTTWLQQQSEPLRSGSNMTSLLVRMLNTISQQPERASEVPLLRHDFMLDQHQNWRWVESNPIAAGMGPLNEQWLSLLRSNSPPASWADNSATLSQAQLLFDAAKLQAERAGHGYPLIVFVVEPVEGNRLDQELLAQALRQLGARVLRKTLPELYTATVSPQHRLQLAEGEADLLYFRTGYNLDDLAADTAAWHQHRTQWQRLRLALCPGIRLQLAGSKWIQTKIQQELAQNPSRLPIPASWDKHDRQQLQNLTVATTPAAELKKATAIQLLQQGWLLKNQQEGGGHLLQTADAIDRIQQGVEPAEGFVLMQRIPALIRTEGVFTQRQGKIKHWPKAISELGLFTVGSSANYGGYLLRTKQAAQLEGGIHKGGAVLDTVQLQPDACCNRWLDSGVNSRAYTATKSHLPTSNAI